MDENKKNGKGKNNFYFKIIGVTGGICSGKSSGVSYIGQLGGSFIY
jgi:hypothetical protein